MDVSSPRARLNNDRVTDVGGSLTNEPQASRPFWPGRTTEPLLNCRGRVRRAGHTSLPATSTGRSHPLAGRNVACYAWATGWRCSRPTSTRRCASALDAALPRALDTRRVRQSRRLWPRGRRRRRGPSPIRHGGLTPLPASEMLHTVLVAFGEEGKAGASARSRLSASGAATRFTRVAPAAHTKGQR